jgi:thymidine kinase
MPRLLAIAESVTKLSAICVVCGAQASRTQRTFGSLDSNATVAVGAREMYEARCRFCHEPETHGLQPGRPEVMTRVPS